MKVTVVDYGVGNLYSVQRALEFCGASRVVISSSPADILDADRVIVPGVGAFADGMQGIKNGGLLDPILNYVALGRPLLGICLGMQMLATVSEEFGSHNGLNLIPGRVVAIPQQRVDGALRKIPFIGWSTLKASSDSCLSDSVLSEFPVNGSVYLVHSFHVQPDNSENMLATYDFEGCVVTAAIQRGNVTGLQFHPEKSGELGLEILTKFIR